MLVIGASLYACPKSFRGCSAWNLEVLFDDPVINPPLKAIQTEQRETIARGVRHSGDFDRLELLLVQHLDPTHSRAIREVNGDHKLVLGVQAHESDQAGIIRVV